MSRHCVKSASKDLLASVFSRDVSEVKVVEVAKKRIERIAENNPSDRVEHSILCRV